MLRWVFQLGREFFQIFGHWYQVQTYPKQDLQIRKWSYGEHPQQYLLECWLPECERADRPLIVFIHGGGWQFAKPDYFTANAHKLASLGFRVIMPCHRKIFRYRYPAMREDLQLINAWVATRPQAARGVILGGMSSGGNLSAHQGLDPDFPPPFKVLGLYFLGAPLDLDQMVMSPPVFGFAGWRGTTQYQKANAIRLADAVQDERIWIGHGDQDAVVPVAAARSFYRRLADRQPAYVEYCELPGGNHIKIAAWSYDKNPLADKLIDWLSSFVVKKSQEA